MIALSSGFHSFLKKKKNLIQYIKLRSLSFSNLSPENALYQSLPIPEKLASYLEHCSDVVSLRKLHACVFTFGLQNDIFLGSKLLNCYAKLGFLTDCRWVVDKIINNSLSLWNSILVGYFRAGYLEEVLRLYLDLRQRKIGANGLAITFGLKSCTELENSQFGREIHADAFKFGLNADGFVGSSLIGLYSKNGDIHSAHKVFDEITERDVVAYTSMITAYAQSGDHRAYEAFDVVRFMQEQELCPNRVTLVSLLQAAGHSEALQEGRAIHGYALTRGIGYSDEVFETSLMDMYIKCGAMNMASSIFSKTSTRTVASWNALIAGHLQTGHPLEALNLFFLMLQQNLDPDLITLANGIVSCADLRYLREGKSIHGYIIRSGLQLDLVAATSLIDMYSKCNSLTQAKKIFSRMEEKDVISFNVMMAGYLQNGFACEAMETFYEMVGIGIVSNPSSIIIILSVFSDLKDLRRGRWVHGYVLRHGSGLNTEIANQIIHMYAKCGCIDSARRVFNWTEYKDLVSWTSMMMGYVFHGLADEAIAFFRVMQREKVTVDSITFLSLLHAFSQLGCLDLAKEVHCRVYRVSMEQEIPLVNSLITTYGKCGKLNMSSDLFEQMSDRCLTSWNSMIAAYGMHGNCVAAFALFDQMKEEKVGPDEVTFTSLISVCSHSGLVEQGLCVFRSMQEEYNIIPSEEHYGCMVDLLSRAGRIEEAYDLLNRLPLRQRSTSLGALLAACRVHGNPRMGEVIGWQLMDLEPENSSAYGLVSNLYAEGNKWNHAARIRAMAKDRGLKRTPGFSLIEIDKPIYQM
ncbi:pentatricopeptide repeat-containing protein At4g21300-like [Actinidia eriantha]|uniref:pentatricopeptide repeat-containing protein At4g21300-like n=1 Tax=Actinidia eriantha TaxID=165200 RepID=UPI00258B3989|nr:pentatricopeptide repeat-containing protein At4g21300-like [Actinidia eriantha]